MMAEHLYFWPRHRVWLASVIGCGLLFSCANETAERQLWRDCGNWSHEVCWGSPASRACEYEFYKECINE